MEATRAGDAMISFLEDVLDICITEPDVSPVDSSVQVARAAAASVATVFAQQSDPTALSPEAVAAAVESAVRAATSGQANSAAPPQDFKAALPGWVLVLFGMLVPGARGFVAQHTG